ncbi:MAG: hypothetical protein RRC07_13210, partial [Anaerolineae bacterium]|nr:hypothetical protein [Anaerolineae bacterium]
AELEEALTWLDEVPEGVAVAPEGAVPQDLEEAMNWLDALPGEEAGAADVGEAPEDLDEAMDWLEQLAAQQGVPLEELPSLAGVAPEAEVDEAERLEIPEAAEVEPEPEPNLEWMETLAEAEELVAKEAGEGAFAEEEFDVPEDLDEAMAWLEGLAAQQGAPLDELPSIETDEDLLLTPFEDELEEKAVEEFAAETPVTEAGEETVIDLEAVPEDLEEAMAWLEELAAQQAPAEEAAAPAEEIEPEVELAQGEAALVETEVELPEAEAERAEVPEEAALEPSLTDEDETPEAMVVPDVAMMYLDSLVEGEGRFGDEAEWTEEAAPAADLVAEIPDDPEAALAWLEELAGGPEPEAPAVSPPEPEAAEDAVAGLPPEIEVDVDDVPEDPDEVMAWLERLAARQGASLDELPSVDKYVEDVETPDWLAAEIAEDEAEEEVETFAGPAESVADVEAEAEPEISALEEEAPAGVDEEADEASWLDEETGLEWLDAVTSDQPSEGREWLDESEVATEEIAEEAADEAAVLEEPALPVLDDESDDLMPDWLTMDEDSWLEEEADITSWLEAEEEMTQVSPETPPPAVAPLEPARQPAPEAKPEPEPEVTFQRMAAPEEMDAARLEAARADLDEGNLDAALGVYQELLDAGAGLNVIIADLELATDAGYTPALCRVLGDTYMQNGQLNRALEVYRKALDLL